MTLHLPKYVFEKNLCSFLDLLCQRNSADSVRLDFLNVKHYIPAAITLIVASIRNWEAQGKEVVLVNHQNNEAFRYLQRIDFFTALGLHYQEDFKGFAKGSCRYVCNQRNQQGSLLRHLRSVRILRYL